VKKRFEFRASSLDERREFYEKEFDINKVKRWFYGNGLSLPQLCALDAGTETGIILDKKLKGKMFYFNFKDLKRKIKKYVPEDLYYDRNIYENPHRILNSLKFNNWKKQELAFDIDADNIKCKCHKREKLCDSCIKRAFGLAKKMKARLKEKFRNIKIVYSGRGFHLHILDKKAFLLSIKEREELNKKFSRFPIDSWVSRGYIRLIRMPYSLNGLISRKVIPIKISRFNKKQAYPLFLKNN